MKKSKTIIFLLFAMFLTIATVNTNAQLNNYGLKIGLQANYALVWNEFEADGMSYLVRPFARIELGSMFDLGLGVGYGTLQMKDYGGNSVTTSIIPADLRILFSPVQSDSWSPYFYLGVGGVYWSLDTEPTNPAPSASMGEESQFDMFLPAGLGAEFAVNDNLLLDVSVGLSVVNDDYMNGYATPNSSDDANKYDKWWTAGIGLAYSVGGCDFDEDKDGLGDVSIGVSHISFKGIKKKHPDFSSNYIYLSWVGTIDLPLNSSLSAGLKIGSYLMSFDNDTLNSFQKNESELAVGPYAVFYFPVFNYISLSLSGEFITVFTKRSMKFLYLSAGVSYSFSTPNWLKRVFE